MDTARIERRIRQYDKALRFRRSLERFDTYLIERKTARGRIGRTLPSGLPYTPDAGRRREEGHVLVGHLPRANFRVNELMDALKASDTWRQKPLWQRVEDREAFDRANKAHSKASDSRHKAAAFWNRYVSTYKQRVYVPVQIT